ncbi:DUF916 and DUF3324 domain-containing protein [Enterococcus hulanensis]|uniref:DUF916 and DUF3324 domain-containing protein n=1 Tax=Enterococcus hulanensis TaxID=2559929 RepID=A0ABU3EYH6_9ENTE|nr:DUF916 and DUF3324 domain-containing protein [Enterococcus hulanensis]MDT2599923.1 DUF916 and DUF3324 domain-containing protein [Enterococcus hulanensis]MDT2609997.1 DUF916 and DUF3324 domain-containing protein [Enterococcus hulanensis]MDT2617804.1 DUF916 and DUF3324 domain-containing protein [Enterococcus hulanensis]MDT2630628.1 DUF916 and DUF3324 domain-containing protein [Enterococcus hulanensis]MDT2656369.1 DUF916 and DUF3324 domain-containing protein [Enterococcus hulanensis]
MKRIVASLLVFVCLSFSFASAAFADENEDQKNRDTMGFTVETVLPSNQVDPSRSFYFLKVIPGEAQRIQLKIISTRKEARTVKVSLNDAMTSSEASIDYGVDKPELDDSLKNPVTELVKVPEEFKEVTVENYEEKTIELEITPPQEEFSGIKLGAIRLIGVPNDSESKKTGLKVETGYTIGMVLTEDAAQYNSGGELHFKKADVFLSNGSKVVGVSLQNDQPKMIDQMKMNVKVRKKGSDKVLYEKKGEDLSVAPNTNFTYQVPLGLENVEAGKYSVEIVAQNEEKTWKWTKEISITNEAANKLNDEAVDKVITPSWVPIATVVLALALVILVVIIMNRNRSIQRKK